MGWWKFLSPKLAHDLAPLGLRLFTTFSFKQDAGWRSFVWQGLHFRNPLGIAGGVDKNGESILDWQELGAGFLEIGTVTPLPQLPNPGKIIDRDWERKILWNKMGFPSEGAMEVANNLEHIKADCHIPLFLNLGKNRVTPNSEAAKDYALVAKKFLHLVDAFVVNVSSPNTSGLRDLQRSEELTKILQEVITVAGKKPILVKLSPDLSPDDLRDSVETCLNAGVKGLILTNTTLARPEHSDFPKEGGLSGDYLRSRSEATLEYVIQILGNRKKDTLVISVGGLLSKEDILKRLQMGADLVQFYSALVFHGPGFFKSVLKKLKQENPSTKKFDSLVHQESLT